MSSCETPDLPLPRVRIEVDGKVFEALAGQTGNDEYEWNSGTNAGYDFPSSRSDGIPSTMTQTNEPHYNANMVRAEKDTAGPIGKGTRFRSAVRSAGGSAEMLIETTGYDRPRLLASTTTMKQMDIQYTLQFEPVVGGTRMRWSGEVRPKGGLRLLGPLVTWMGTRQEQRIWSSLKSHLECAPVAQG